MPGLVIYVRIDGGFSVWDPARNYWKKPAAREYEQADRPAAFQFTQEQVWKGLETEEGTVLCNGLLRDWILWQFQKKELFQVLTKVLAGLSPRADEVLRPGEPIRSSLVDVREEPTLELPYGTIPVTIASAGMRRVLALAYLLVWTWSEHKAASQLLQQTPTDRLVLLMDEVEAHLHPQWQRVLLPEVLAVTSELYSDMFKQNIQILAATHAPLVLASIESMFDPETDRLITFLPRKEKLDVVVATEEWSKQGDVLGWLVSDAFGLKQARSREAERAIESAEAFMREDLNALPPDLRTREQIHQELMRLLPGHDPFWPRWVVAGKEIER
ncbi:MAG: AAA family ATPase [Thermodesulfobacteriota bacterium]